MKAIFFCLIFATCSIFSTNIISFEEDLQSEDIKKQIFELAFLGEPPRSFYNQEPLSMSNELSKILPTAKLHWIPPTLWQLGMLHAFFQDKDIHGDILTYLGSSWNPMCYDDDVHFFLSKAENFDEILAFFDDKSKSLPNIINLFFKVNEALHKLYERSNFSSTKMLDIILDEIPEISQWKHEGFPFWKSPWIYNLNSPSLFYQALKDKKFVSKIMDIEEKAHENSSWVFYRGYSGEKLPSTLQINEDSNHALSFGSTLLGGAFFSLESCALTYAKAEEESNYFFLALTLHQDEINTLLRVGPINPFIQMLVDGEMFHAHTKVTASNAGSYSVKNLNGYFMKCNKNCFDPIGYVLNMDMLPMQFERKFLSVCKRSGYTFEAKK